MKIGFEASNVIGKNPTGVAIYIKNFINSIADLKSGNDLQIFYKASRLNKRKNWLKLDSISNKIYFHSYFKNVDIIHGLDTFVPNWQGCQKFVTFHDIVPLLFTDELYTPKDFRIKKENDYRNAVNIADKIITVSENTKKDLVEYFQVSPTKIETVYPGLDSNIFVKKSVEEIEKVRQYYELKENYLLFVGTIAGRKNTARLVEAFARTKAKTDFELVLAGSLSYMGDLTLQAIEKNRLQEKVKILGYIENEHLPALYSGAKGFLFPTIYEGFGFPILEAMLCETPVLASNIGSAPEIGGDFPVFVNPQDIDSIADGIDKLLERNDFNLVKAREYARQYSWETSARKMLKIYKETLNNWK